MIFENKSPNWQAGGVEPPNNLKQQGFAAGYKPPAVYFNWLLTRISACITELQIVNSSLDKRIKLPISVLFDNKNIPIEISNSKILSAGFATGNTKVKTVFISSKVEVVQNGTFMGCSNLNDVYVDNTQDKLTIQDGSIPPKAKIHFADNFNINDYIIQALNNINNFVVNGVGELENLNTTENTTLVAAINELVDKLTYTIGQSGSGDAAEIFNDYSGNKAIGMYSHAEGCNTTARGIFSHAEGSNTTAQGLASHAEGQATVADGACSHAGGYSTVANNYQFVAGKYNKIVNAPKSSSDTTGSIFIVGIGTSSDATANAFRISADGKCYGSSAFAASGADYAEYFEWFDGNPDNEDRRGLFVTLDGEKIRIANANDDYILGIVSATPVVYGDVQSEAWKDVFLTDVYGERLTEIVEVPESVDEETGQTILAHTETRFIINPDYDPTREYESRENRKEWSAIGLVGKLVVIDDGTCQTNGYCKVADGGIATNSTEKTAYRVLSRLDDNHIKILLK